MFLRAGRVYVLRVFLYGAVCSISTGARQVMNLADGTVYTWAGVPTCGERACTNRSWRGIRVQ